MIKDRITNADMYFELSADIKRGLEWFKNTDLKNISDGRYELDGDKLFVNVQSYETKDSALFEAHRKYADIQFMIEGAEKIETAEYADCKMAVPYDNDKDIEFLNCDKFKNIQFLKEGQFMILFPQDAHKPSLNPEKKLRVKKAVVKVLL